MKSCRREAYSLAEVLIAVLVTGTALISLYAGFCSGFSVVQLGRENLRATQILTEHMEAMRVYNWRQVRDTNNFYVLPKASDRYSIGNTNSGVMYAIQVRTNAATNLPAAYCHDVLLITATAFWTNRQGKETIVRNREMQTYVARYGMRLSQ